MGSQARIHLGQKWRNVRDLECLGTVDYSLGQMASGAGPLPSHP